MFIYILVLLESATTFPLINAVQVSGFFMFYGIFSFCSIFFTYFFVGETKGLSDKQKKELYIPGGPYGRKLKPDEIYRMNQDTEDDSDHNIQLRMV